jgi:hypothetical protein
MFDGLVAVEAGGSLFGDVLLVHELFVLCLLHDLLFVVMAVEAFFRAHWRFAPYEMKMTALASHLGLFKGLVGNSLFGILALFSGLSFFFLGLQRLCGDLVAECALGAFYIEFSVLEMTEKAFFLGNLEMFLFTLTLMAGGAVEFLPFYLFLRVKMFVMDKWNNAFALICSFELGVFDFLCPVFSLFTYAGCRMAPRARTA